jgi:coenzyme F420-reducing hydrogenase beta subunit
MKYPYSKKSSLADVRVAIENAEDLARTIKSKTLRYMVINALLEAKSYVKRTEQGLSIFT